MAAKTTSGAAPSSADGAWLDVARPPDTLANERSDISETPTLRGGREQAHVHARRHRRWLRGCTNPDGDDIEIRAGTSPDASQRSVVSVAENGRRP